MIEHISNSIRTEMTESEGIRISYTRRTPPWQIVRKVKPRAQNIVKELSVGSEEDQIANLVIEGENLQAMVSLYKYRGQVDLILTDPPYKNTQYLKTEPPFIPGLRSRVFPAAKV